MLGLPPSHKHFDRLIACGRRIPYICAKHSTSLWINVTSPRPQRASSELNGKKTAISQFGNGGRCHRPARHPLSVWPNIRHFLHRDPLRPFENRSSVQEHAAFNQPLHSSLVRAAWIRQVPQQISSVFGRALCKTPTCRISLTMGRPPVMAGTLLFTACKTRKGKVG